MIASDFDKFAAIREIRDSSLDASSDQQYVHFQPFSKTAIASLSRGRGKNRSKVIGKRIEKNVKTNFRFARGASHACCSWATRDSRISSMRTIRPKRCELLMHDTDRSPHPASSTGHGHRRVLPFVFFSHHPFIFRSLRRRGPSRSFSFFFSLSFVSHSQAHCRGTASILF